MTSSLGLDVNHACAAFRAGLVRSATSRLLEFRSGIKGEFENLVCHQAAFIGEDFQGDARLVRLAQTGLTDLKNKLTAEYIQSTNLGFYISFPNPTRVYHSLDLIADEQLKTTLKEEYEENQEYMECTVDTLIRDVMQLAVQYADWPAQIEVRSASGRGHTGVAEVTHHAVNDLLNGKIEAAVVFAVDSLLYEDVLGLLLNGQRMKTPDSAVGLQPGEAVAAFVLEKASLSNLSSLGIKNVAFAHEAQSVSSGQPSQGLGLFNVVEQLGAIDNSYFVSDINGETYRAYEWGAGLVRLKEIHGDMLDRLHHWYPAQGFGDTGAASGAVAVCVANAAFERGYAPASEAIILSAADDGQRSAMRLGAV